MTFTEIALILIALQIKHFIAEFVYQPPFMFDNKGTYGHLGGIAHTLHHGWLSLAVLAIAGPIWLILSLVAVEMIIHYHADWLDRSTQKRLKITLADSPQGFWLITGADQAVHQLTYIAMIWVLVAYQGIA